MAKYDILRKLERNRLLVQYRQAHPELSLQEIGAVFNITRERVSQILKAEKNKQPTSSPAEE